MEDEQQVQCANCLRTLYWVAYGGLLASCVPIVRRQAIERVMTTIFDIEIQPLSSTCGCWAYRKSHSALGEKFT